jgi:ribosomal protein S18 acetylase RimI-like enzyme
MKVTLRRAQGEDAEVLADIHIAAVRDAMPYLPELHTDEETHAWMRDVVLAGSEVYIADADGSAVGFVALGSDMLEHLYVVPDFQDRRVGSALLARAKELRPDGFRLWVFQRNEGARRFYERHGLRLVELTDGAANEEREPDALYEWRPLRRAGATS